MVRRVLAFVVSVVILLGGLVPLVLAASSTVASATTSGCSLDVSSVRSAHYGITPFTLGPTDPYGYSAMFTINCGAAPVLHPYSYGDVTFEFNVAGGGQFGAWGISGSFVINYPSSFVAGAPLAVGCVLTTSPYGSAAAKLTTTDGSSFEGAQCTDGGYTLNYGTFVLNNYTVNYDSACPSTENLGVWDNGPQNSTSELQCTTVNSLNGVYLPCSDVEVAGQMSPQPGSSYSYNFQWMGQCTEFAISSFLDPQFTANPPDYTPSLATGGSSTLPHVFDGFTSGNSSGGLFPLAVNLTDWGYTPLPVGWTSFADQAEVWAAYGPVGSLTWVDIGPLAGLVSTSVFSATGVPPVGGGSVYPSVGGSGSSAPSSFGACVASAGMSLTDPLTWVTGAMEIGRCTLVVLFVPSSASWDAVVNEFGFSSVGGGSGSCGSTLPGMVSGSASQWLGAGFTLIADGPSCSFGLLQSQEAAGATNAFLSQGMSFSSSGRTYTVSLPGALSSVESNSQFSAMATLILALLTAVVGVAFFFAIKSLLQRVLGDGGE